MATAGRKRVRKVFDPQALPLVVTRPAIAPKADDDFEGDYFKSEKSERAQRREVEKLGKVIDLDAAPEPAPAQKVAVRATMVVPSRGNQRMKAVRCLVTRSVRFGPLVIELVKDKNIQIPHAIYERLASAGEVI